MTSRLITMTMLTAMTAISQRFSRGPDMSVSTVPLSVLVVGVSDGTVVGSVIGGREEKERERERERGCSRRLNFVV